MSHTPSVYSIESAYCHVQQETLQERGPEAHTKFHAEFCAWLTAYTNQVKAQALEEAAEAWENGTVDYFEIKHSSDAPLGWSDESVADAIMSSGPVMDWLRKRAKQIKDQQ